MGADRYVSWSEEARTQVQIIKEYIKRQWSDQEVEAFMDLLQEFESLVLRYPNGYARSELFEGCRRAVIHPNVSVVYKVIANEIEVVTVYDNRSRKSFL